MFLQFNKAEAESSSTKILKNKMIPFELIEHDLFQRMKGIYMFPKDRAQINTHTHTCVLLLSLFMYTHTEQMDYVYFSLQGDLSSVCASGQRDLSKEGASNGSNERQKGYCPCIQKKARQGLY